MLCAYSKHGEMVCLPSYTREEIIQLRQRSTFYCPSCKEDLIIKAGTEIIPHFSHKVTSACTGGGEGEIHEQGKWMIYTWLQKQFNNVQLEIFLPDIQQRPDILITTDTQQIAIEYQCSALSPTILRKRTASYQSAHIFPIWILHPKHLQQRARHRFTINSFVKQCLFQPTTHPSPMLIFFCPEKKQLTLLNHILFISLTTTFAQKRILSLEHTRLPDLFQQPIVENNVLLTMWKDEKRAFRFQHRGGTGKQREWLIWLYERGLPIDYLPSIIHLPVKGQLFMNVQPWNWQSRLWYFLQHTVTTNQLFTLDDCVRELAPFIHPSDHYPLLTHISSPIASYIHWLMILGYVERMSPNQFQLRTSIQPLSHIEEAIKQDSHVMNQILQTTKTK